MIKKTQKMIKNDKKWSKMIKNDQKNAKNDQKTQKTISLLINKKLDDSFFIRKDKVAI